MNNKPVSYIIKSIAIGYILIYVHLNIGNLDILPDFLGYLIIVRALPRLAQRQKSAMLIKAPGIALAVWNIIESVIKLSGVDFNLYVINIIVSILGIYFNFQLITDISEFATDEKRKKRLLTLRSGVVIFHTLTVILALIPDIRTAALITGIAQLVMLAWICIELFRLAADIKGEEQKATNQETAKQEATEYILCEPDKAQAPESTDNK